MDRKSTELTMLVTRRLGRVLLLVALLLPTASLAAGPRVEDVADALKRDPSFKVRVEAALILGRLKAPAAVPALIEALGDKHPAVRATAARALGATGDARAREPLQRAATGDAAPPVRKSALAALDRLARAEPPAAVNGEKAAAPRLAFSVKPVADRSRHASPALRVRMRDAVSSRLKPIGEVALDGSQPGYVIDGVIKDLTITTGPLAVEVACQVQLVVSRHPAGGIFLMTSGEAIVQKPRHQFRPKQKASMELEALDGAVRGASEDLVSHLASLR